MLKYVDKTSTTYVGNNISQHQDKTGKNISLSVVVVITPTTNTLAITSANNKER